jgi:hypothetical protein
VARPLDPITNRPPIPLVVEQFVTQREAGRFKIRQLFDKGLKINTEALSDLGIVDVQRYLRPVIRIHGRLDHGPHRPDSYFMIALAGL